MCWLGDKGRQACPQKRKKAIKVWNVCEIKQAGWNMQKLKGRQSLGINNRRGVEHDVTKDVRQGHTRTTLTRHTKVKSKSLNATYGHMEMAQGTSTMAGGVELRKRQSGELLRPETH